MQVPIGPIGLILNSDRAGHFVRVEDDSENTGGFLVFEWWVDSGGPNKEGAFDSWVENLESLGKFFVESGWEVKWG